MNFAYGVIAIVGVLAAIILGLIVTSPDDIIKPRIIPVISDDIIEPIIIPIEEKATVCTMQWDPMCGADGETYGNLCMLDVANVKLDHEGECVIAQPEPESSPLTSKVLAPPEIHTVSIPEGVGVPGCDETNECYSPYSLQIRVGDTVIWNNIDTAVHTVTSGSIGGNSELFDSSIIMSGETFDITFSDAGTFDYYCFVHPWMTGEVVVNKVEEMVVVSEPTVVVSEPTVVVSEPTVVVEPKPEVEPKMEIETLSMALTISIPNGVGVLGCEETRECYSPYEVSVAVGTTVTWSNDDITIHTVTSGNPGKGANGLFHYQIMSGETFDITFSDAGTFDYYCFVHPWMTGIVNVR